MASSMRLARPEPSPWARSHAAAHLITDAHGIPVPQVRTHVGDPAYYAPANHEMAAAASGKHQQAAGGSFMFESASLQRPPTTIYLRTEAVPNLATTYVGRAARV